MALAARGPSAMPGRQVPRQAPATSSTSSADAELPLPAAAPALRGLRWFRHRSSAAGTSAAGSTSARSSLPPSAALVLAAAVAGSTGALRSRRRAGDVRRSGRGCRGGGRSRVALGEGLGTVQVVLAEGLGPDVASRFEERQAEVEQVIRKLQRLTQSHKLLAACVEGRGDASQAELQEDARVWTDMLQLRQRLDFLRGLDQVEDLDLSPEASGILSSGTGGGKAAKGLPQKLKQLRGPAAEVTEEFWDGLLGPDDSVFLEYGFLSSLEESGCTCLERGWQPRFLLARGGGRLLGAVPLYLKMDSSGEFCEEMDWIQASYRFGVPHFPKLFVGIPFTPHRGRRLIAAAWLGAAERSAVEQALLRALVQLSARAQLGVNVAFGAAEEGELFQAAGFVKRLARQAWWTNREPQPYQDFGDFLGVLKSKNARAIARQRRELAAVEGLEIEVVDGAHNADAVTAELMAEVFDRCYASTQVRHGNAEALGPGEIRFDLSRAFFRLLAERFSHRVLLVLARCRPSSGGDSADRSERAALVGGSLCFAKGKMICGRYWGHHLKVERVPFLHFECCYHRLVEHAIEHGYSRVEPGNGGGSIYRVQRDRGFEPVLTPSYHWVPQPELREELGRLAELAVQEGPPSWVAARHTAYAPASRSKPARQPPPKGQGAAR